MCASPCNTHIHIIMNICVLTCLCVRGCTPVNERDSSVCATRTGNRPRVSGRKGIVMIGSRRVGREEDREGMSNPYVAATAATVKVR